MKNTAIKILSVFVIILTLVNCREQTTEEKAKDAIEEVGDDIEEGVEEVEDEIDDATDK
ncbi:hypothetical protein ACFSQJ_01805 [Croceitalea marina]|uniref:Uncharacterized protein n=1 Tax=Croceitalea marina TaxID=1775166 RepID=A0ABW5MR75_9FLAO